MQLVESYLLEVSKFIPQRSAPEVLSDLRSAIVEEVLDRADSRGGDVSPDDERAVLKGFGHPLRVATRYRPERYLIGPQLYPSFIHALQVTVGLVLTGYVVVALVAAYVSGWQVSPGGVISSMLNLMFWMALTVTAVFASLEYAGEKLDWYERWTPDQLSPRIWGPVDRGVVGTNLVTDGIYLLWWNDVLVLQNWLPFIDGQFVVSLAPVWQAFYWPINLLVGMSFVLHAYLLLQGSWRRWSLVASIVLCIALLGVIAGLAHAEQLVVLNSPMAAYTDNVERAFRVSFAVIALVLLWDTRWAFRTMIGMATGRYRS